MLPAPNLDDRRFQDLVDDAKRLVQRRCPEWTDHNVSDPGVTLIETFAYMTDQLLYRLNRVPDRLYVKFLELIGVRLLPPTPARVPVTFWLASPAVRIIPIQPGTEVSTVRTDVDDAIAFNTFEELRILPCKLDRVGTGGANATDPSADANWADRTDQLTMTSPFAAFSGPPHPGDCLYLGLSEAVPSCAVALTMVCRIDGVGVDPDNPPLTWEAWNGDGWEPCELDHDNTGGLNRDGRIVLHVPPTHQVSVLREQRAGWIRARVVEADADQPEYTSPPLIRGVGAATIGGTTDAVHAEVIRNETLGVSDGTPGQRFRTRRAPVLAGGGPVVFQTSSDEGWQEWTPVENFADSGPDDRNFILDPVNGEIALGPAVRQADGTYDQYGYVPPRGADVRLATYTVGGGAAGNVARRAIAVLRTAIPYVSSVENRYPAQGGVEGETLDEAKARGPITLRTRSRAVTAEDYELLTRQAAPEIARVKCLTAGEGPDAGSVKILLVPAVATDPVTVEFEQLLLSDAILDKVSERLDDARLIGTRLLVEPPLYQGVTVVARLTAAPRASAARVEQDCLATLFRFLNPLVGGANGDGWAWGRAVQAGDIYGVLQQVRGVDIVTDVRLYGANPVTRERGDAAQRLELDAASLVFSFDHQILVEQH
jgi:predicted phage baseplate assembly protein